MASKKDKTTISTIILILCVIIAATFRLWKPDFSHKEDNLHIEYKSNQPSKDSIISHSQKVDAILSMQRKPIKRSLERKAAIGFRFSSSTDYHKAFPDLNDIQLATASRLGVACCNNREEAIHRKDDLVYVGSNPFYEVDDLKHSIPYLIPRAARLLNEIARSFLDSLDSRGLPHYKIMVTSLLRTTEDIQKLKKINVNASENSCHRHATTFDICYNKFVKINDLDEPSSNNTWPIELKQILAEVLDDQRKQGTCYIKYEYRQACFHITAR